MKGSQGRNEQNLDCKKVYRKKERKKEKHPNLLYPQGCKEKKRTGTYRLTTEEAYESITTRNHQTVVARALNSERNSGLPSNLIFKWRSSNRLKPELTCFGSYWIYHSWSFHKHHCVEHWTTSLLRCLPVEMPLLVHELQVGQWVSGAALNRTPEDV